MNKIQARRHKVLQSLDWDFEFHPTRKVTAREVGEKLNMSARSVSAILSWLWGEGYVERIAISKHDALLWRAKDNGLRDYLARYDPLPPVP